MATNNGNKKYKPEDTIECKSITNGQLIFSGAKSKILYKWAAYGDVEEIEYQDLLYAVRRRSGFVMKPRFIIMDDDFVKQHKELNKVYENLYTHKDLRGILKLDSKKMIEKIDVLPEGAKEAIKGLASTMIDNGQLDSAKKIKALDEYFGTKLLLTLAND